VKPWLFIAAGLVLLFGRPIVPALPTLPAWPWSVTAPAAPVVADRVVYVYEKDDGDSPAWVTTGLNRLNRERRVVATLFEDNTTNGAGDIPTQYREAVPAARVAGLPALVVLGGTNVLRVVPAPATEAAVMEAVP